jgi:predicted DNA-binding protein
MVLAKKTYRTKTGRELIDADVEATATEVEQTDYDVAALKARRGRPLLGSAPAEVVAVRLDPELREAIEQRAEAESTTTSEVIRRALRAYLDVA